MKKIQFPINRLETIRRVQDNFSLQFPHLQVNFFDYNQKTGIRSNSAMYSPESEISSINPACQNGYIEIDEETSVKTLENILLDRFGLFAQITCKSENHVTLPAIADESMSKQDLKQKDEKLIYQP